MQLSPLCTISNTSASNASHVRYAPASIRRLMPFKQMGALHRVLSHCHFIRPLNRSYQIHEEVSVPFFSEATMRRTLP
jgi:hypothetical protein